MVGYASLEITEHISLIWLCPGVWLFACSNLLPIFLVAVILCALSSIPDIEYALFRAMAYLFFVLTWMWADHVLLGKDRCFIFMSVCLLSHYFQVP